MKKKYGRKLFVLGIDGAMPEMIFSEWLDELPNIKELMSVGCYAKLKSTLPPVSVVAWTSMTTGKPPAEHGVFECLHRKNNSYEQNIVTSKNVKEKRIWDFVGESGKKVISCLVPLTWPIKPLNGVAISGFMTPMMDHIEFTYPKELKQEIESFLGEPFLIEKENYRNLSKEELLTSIFGITEMHFKVMKYLIKNKQWDLFFGVIIGSDRLNHGFWRYCDKTHRKYLPGSKFENSLKEFYKLIDKDLGEILELLDENTTIIVLSDHGITKMHNRINLGDWLIKEGYMVLKPEVKFDSPTKFEISMVDWEKTRIFAMGAFDAQIFINLQGREPNGIVKKEEYGPLIKELEEKLKKIRGDDGKEIDTKIYIKKRDYDGKFIDIAPDMIVYFDNLQYGCNVSLLGNPTLWSPRTSAGSDDAAHSQKGIFVMKNNKNRKIDLGEISILDIAPTILNELGLETPEDIRGKIIE